MSELSSHNNADAKKEQAQKSKQSRVVSTHNVIPYNREMRQKDVDKFIEQRKSILDKKTDEVINPEVAKMPDDDFGIEPPEEKENKHIGESLDKFLEDEEINQSVSGEIIKKKKTGRKKRDAE